MSTQDSVPRRWPDTFIVGAPRCGTSAMHDYLKQHPQIFMSSRKEPLFYARDLPDLPGPRITEPIEYAELFRDARDERRIGEASPYYLYSAAALGDIHRQCPDARIIVMLRNPADMMHSMYWAWSYAGFERSRSLEAALDRERRETADGTLRFILRYRYLTRYSEHVERYVETFGRSRVHVVLFEDLESDPLGMYRYVCRFLDVSVDYQPRFRLDGLHQASSRRPLSRRLASFANSPRSSAIMGHRMTSVLRRGIRRWGSRKPPAIRAELRAQIQQEYASETDRLSRAIGHDLNRWR